MEFTTLQAFVKEASSLYSGGPPDYLSVHVAMERLYPGLKKTAGKWGWDDAVVGSTLAIAGGEAIRRKKAKKRSQKEAELKKTATGALGHAIEVAGLGILAKPATDTLRGKKEHSEKSKAKWEAAGLGTLAAPSAYHLVRPGLSKILPKVFPKILSHA